MLLEKGADINAQGGRYGNALQTASQGGQVSSELTGDRASGLCPRHLAADAIMMTAMLTAP